MKIDLDSRPLRKVPTCKMQAQPVKCMTVGRGFSWSKMKHYRTHCGLSTALQRTQTIRELRKMAMDPRPRKIVARRRQDDETKTEGTPQNKTIVWGRGEREKTSFFECEDQHYGRQDAHQDLQLSHGSKYDVRGPESGIAYRKIRPVITRTRAAQPSWRQSSVP